MRHLAVLRQVRSCLLYTLLLLAPSPAVCIYPGYDLHDLQDLKILQIPDLKLTDRLPAHAFMNPRSLKLEAPPLGSAFGSDSEASASVADFASFNIIRNVVGPRIGSPHSTSTFLYTPPYHFP